MSQDWNVGKKAKQLIQVEPEKAVLVGVITKDQSEEQMTEYLDELEFLASTAGALTLKRFTQKLTHPESATFVGSGKLMEIQKYVESNDIDLVIFDDDLSGKQATNLEKELKVKILDRSSLILDIFAERAQTAQAKAQVELAQMQYLLPRLRGLWTHLERQRGGIGMRGPGEQEIETDRRIVREKIAFLKRKLEDIDRQSQTQRKARGTMVRVSLVGYTNVGKSTLMNLVSKSEVLAENKLFATLDTTVRKVVLEQTPFLLSDTVGFIRKLPHHLVESFKSTLDEVRESDLLLHVVDMAHPQFMDHMEVVQQTLRDIGAGDHEVLYIFNKADLYRERYMDKFLTEEEKAAIEEEVRENILDKVQGKGVFVSAITQEGIQNFRDALLLKVRELYEIRYPYVSRFW
jgi:GTP-binding protein HflX